MKYSRPSNTPAFCICEKCETLPAEERGKPRKIRIRRRSPYPQSRVQSVAHALQEVQREIEAELVVKLREADERGRAWFLCHAPRRRGSYPALVRRFSPNGRI